MMQYHKENQYLSWMYDDPYLSKNKMFGHYKLKNSDHYIFKTWIQPKNIHVFEDGFISFLPKSFT
jgi:hypothetical protein